MNAWLTSPRKFAPGTKMTFAGLGNAQDRANVILYLNQQGSNVPLPAAGAPAAAKDQPATADAAEAAATNGSDTANIANTGTPESGAPSIDPEAARKGARSEK
jgi:cytochrome c